MWFGKDADDACDFILGVSGWMLRVLDGEHARTRARDALRATVSSHQTAGGVEFGAAAWIITAAAA
jgi:hypothetical protein